MLHRVAGGTAVSTASAAIPGLDGAASDEALIAEMDEASARFEGADPGDVIAWAVERFGDDIILADSFQDAVLLDFASKRAPGVEVIFLDTGYHFPETLAYMRKLEKRYGLNLNVVEPGRSPSMSSRAARPAAASCARSSRSTRRWRARRRGSPA